ncbi:hypothetical protein BFP70_03225 [Thioclava sp. SK-1]|uniref:hypothetical protein n=1 Tax=Thioclava sp. SK-1 TaxID=1889770 RepID=UPI000825AA0E|nr:hypothetical protein [Thioclava sp. SK-1]OCX67183.1 hypothetical protein BFP70_03225 [Thioclava sp. SK-1]
MIPDESDPRWSRVLTTQAELSSTSLATRILISRLRREVSASPDTLERKVAELRAFISKNSFAVADMGKF